MTEYDNPTVTVMRIQKQSIAHSVIRQSMYQLRLSMKHKQNHPQYIKNLQNIKTLDGQIQCLICREQCERANLFKITECQHQYCQGCVKLHLVYRINLFKEITCPDQSCTAFFDISSPAYKLLTDDQKNQYSKYQSFLRQIRNSNYKICVIKDCKGKFDSNSEQPHCEVCGIKICKNCYLQSHGGDCVQMQISMICNLFKKCFKCNNYIEKSEGCDHIKCICGNQFCYICGASWKGHICSQSFSIQHKSINQKIMSILYRLLAGIWFLIGGLILILIIIILTIQFIIQAIVLGPFVYYYQTLTKIQIEGSDWIIMILIIPGIVYGQFHYLQDYENRKNMIDKCYFFYITHFNLMIQK